MLSIFVSTTQSKRTSSHLLVVLQLLFLVGCCWPVAGRNAGSAWFLILCVLGAMLGVVVLFYNRPTNFSVYPEIRSGARLIVDGPYRYVRHPMYTALMSMMIGIAGFNGHWLNAAAATGIVAVVTTKAWREEQLLPRVFPSYEAYRAGTTRFVPFLL